MVSLTGSATWLTGYVPDLPTPFDEAGELDLKSMARLCERQIEAGASALVVCETAGEAPALSPAEQERVIRTAVEVADRRIRVIAGAVSNSTTETIELTRRAEAAGADALLCVVPYYNRPTQDGIYAHYRALAGATGLPIILHDIPSRTVRELADDTLVRLAERRQFVGLRDATGDVTRPMRLIDRLPPGFRWLSGCDLTAFGFMASGGHGCISTVSNVTPDLCRVVFAHCKQGRLQTARYLQSRIDRLQACLWKDNPAALKYALSLLGLMHPRIRLPLVELDEPATATVAAALAAISDEDLAGVADA